MDIAIDWNSAISEGDWAIVNGDLEAGSSIESAVLVSLYSDQRAPADYVFTGNDTDPRGWWADTYTGFQLGSLLWTLDRIPKSFKNNIPVMAKQYIESSLQWLLDDDLATSVTVTTGWLAPNALGFRCVIVKPDGNVQKFQYSYAWAGI